MIKAIMDLIRRDGMAMKFAVTCVVTLIVILVSIKISIAVMEHKEY